jgi:hypothetical protein
VVLEVLATSLSAQNAPQGDRIAFAISNFEYRNKYLRVLSVPRGKKIKTALPFMGVRILFIREDEQHPWLG